MRKLSEHSGFLLGVAVVTAAVSAIAWGLYAYSWRTIAQTTWSAVVQGCLDYLAPFRGYPALLIAAIIGALLVIGMFTAIIRTAKRLNLDRLFGKSGYAVLDSFTLSDESLESVLDKVEGGIGYRPETLLVQSETPVCLVYGLVKPKLIISTKVIDELSASELEAAVLHEVRHINRRDPLRRVIAEMAADFLFFIPVLRSLSRRIAFAQELEADRFASEATGRPRELAGAILKLAAQNDIGLATALNENWISERVRRLLGLPEKIRPRVGLLAVFVSVIMVAGLVGAPYAIAGENVAADNANACFKKCLSAGVHSSISECKIRCKH